MAQSIDARSGRPTGVRNVTIHRISTTDIDGDDRDDAVFYDDIRHQLTVSAAPTADAELEALLSWPVYEDRTYPYGDEEDQQVREPRAVVALDLDGDGHQDLALLCHDRLLIYLAKEASP